MSKENLSFEQAATRIDEIVNALERGDAPLDKSLEMFEEGAKLIKICSAMLDEAEQKVKGLQINVSKETPDTEQTALQETLFDGDD